MNSKLPPPGIDAKAYGFAAGRIADGVLFQVGSDPALVNYALKNIRLGAEQAGKPCPTRRCVHL